jgi:hypothetical protein
MELTLIITGTIIAVFILCFVGSHCMNLLINYSRNKNEAKRLKEYYE